MLYFAAQRERESTECGEYKPCERNENQPVPRIELPFAFAAKEKENPSDDCRQKYCGKNGIEGIAFMQEQRNECRRYEEYALRYEEQSEVSAYDFIVHMRILLHTLRKDIVKIVNGLLRLGYDYDSIACLNEIDAARYDDMTAAVDGSDKNIGLQLQIL